MSHWSEKEKYQKCTDGGRHDGRLELITWDGVDQDGTKLGWGAVLLEEAEDNKKSFITEYKSDEEKFFEYWPQGFRWTCCGMVGDAGDQGCDHHGPGLTPCSCDFCVGGKPLARKIITQRDASQAAKGLTLATGPDRRSFDPVRRGINDVMREILGLDR